MHLLDLTLDSPIENIALDEALLDAAEAAPDENGEVLRLWEPRELMVVVGNSSRLSDEVHLEACDEHGVPVLRRASGGAAIITGPGCLMYAVVLSYQQRPQLRLIDHAHQFVLDTIAAALNKALHLPLPLGEGRGEGASRATAGLSSSTAPPTAYRLLPTARRAGTSDLVLGNKKFSGNSLRCKRNYFLYHGTLLYNFPLTAISKFLKMPARQPDYREQRAHQDFVTNLPLDAATLRQTLATAFSATEICADWPHALTTQLVAKRYSRSEWNRRL